MKMALTGESVVVKVVQRVFDFDFFQHLILFTSRENCKQVSTHRFSIIIPHADCLSDFGVGLFTKHVYVQLPTAAVNVALPAFAAARRAAASRCCGAGRAAAKTSRTLLQRDRRTDRCSETD